MLKKLIRKIGHAVKGQRGYGKAVSKPDVLAVPAPKETQTEGLAEVHQERQQSARRRRSPKDRQEIPAETHASENSDLGPVKKKRKRKRKPAWSLEQFQVPIVEGETRFHDLDIPEKIMHAIADLGFEYCTPIQTTTLTHTLAGQNIAGRAQTGTGKTAAFLITIFKQFLLNPQHGESPKGTPRALILAPTRELVIQIAEDAKDLSKYCHFNSLAIYGGMDLGKQKDKLQQRAVDIIVATPGRLLDFMQRGNIHLQKLEVLVIDEADRMLDMGFIPDVKRIIRQTPPKDKRRTMLFSATLSEDVLRLASQWMPDPVICEVSPDQVTVDTVEQVIYIVTTRQKFKVLYHLLRKRPDERVLIFCNRRENTHYLATKLHNYGIECSQLSGAVPQKKRLKILDAFKEGRQKVVVATDVAGRGLHVQDIGLVVNYEFPYDAEDYVHRIGRTGRAGVAGMAVSFACEDESFTIPAIEKFIGANLPCRMPEEELLGPLPQVEDKQPQKRPPRPGQNRNRRDSRSRRPSSRPSSQRRSRRT
jgi:ATP-dependent RNA helicase RhlB